jgi:hypothetical protein
MRLAPHQQWEEIVAPGMSKPSLAVSYFQRSIRTICLSLFGLHAWWYGARLGQTEAEVPWLVPRDDAPNETRSPPRAGIQWRDIERESLMRLGMILLSL